MPIETIAQLQAEMDKIGAHVWVVAPLFGHSYQYIGESANNLLAALTDARWEARTGDMGVIYLTAKDTGDYIIVPERSSK